ncbi:hypothetical protein Osc7112_5412 [Oscillatoria nigro-viridis PCC 7112]|uniref:Uncharacterized protein n=1 Tax=Phormidium nigroviride PCC 7112 TaxID=179408 RepID=K9VNI0_9CYAN|nr:hypothetical protein [Oscillatoria nigro-viridis]AFZ09648.1 hypothetical protein Osc7112_5412 [Oscillatoria nigro-viridis PCC 7112]
MTATTVKRSYPVGNRPFKHFCIEDLKSADLAGIAPSKSTNLIAMQPTKYDIT